VLRAAWLIRRMEGKRSRGATKKYKGVGPRMATLRAEMKALRAEWSGWEPRHGRKAVRVAVERHGQWPRYERCGRQPRYNVKSIDLTPFLFSGGSRDTMGGKSRSESCCQGAENGAVGNRDMSGEARVDAFSATDV